LMRELNLNRCRFSLSCSRIQPAGSGQPENALTEVSS
jgi:beta-glucosidase/6-phospho-beta-glucosidase/beta-galactosidase